jgi:methyl-coenzyme M reductase subunit D
MDIEIFPHRYLSAGTTENLLKDLDEIEGVNGFTGTKTSSS